ncbi:MAG: TlpA family protein disulfide reductase, partial [Chloroflexota bacterium]
MTTLPAFTLTDSHHQSHTFPSARPALLCFVREDCVTCNLVLPLIAAMHRTFGDAIDVWCIGQEANDVLIARHHLTMPMLDDTALRVSFQVAIETVPTIIFADANGDELQRVIGFRKSDWQSLISNLQSFGSAQDRLPTSNLQPPTIDWSSLPAYRPGCGSKSVEPGIAEKLQAEADGSPLRARRIEIAPSDDEFEFMFDQGLTDGLPVVPPTPERVLRMLRGTRRDAQAIVAVVPPNLAPATVEKVAVNAVMAGCKPEYLPVVIAALEAVCTDEFNIHGVMATTWGAT